MKMKTHHTGKELSLQEDEGSIEVEKVARVGTPIAMRRPFVLLSHHIHRPECFIAKLSILRELQARHRGRTEPPHLVHRRHLLR